MRNVIPSASVFFVAVLAVLAAGEGAVPQTDYSLIQKYRVLEKTVTEAQKYLDQGQTDRCSAELAKCFQTVPDHHAGQYIRAQLLYKQSEFAGALEAMGKARTGYRRLIDILEKFKAEKITKQMDDAQAMADLGPILEADWAVAVCRKPLLSGQIMENDKSLSDTKRETYGDMAKPADVVPAEYDYFTGNCQFKLKRYEEAAASYRGAIATDPGHANACNNLINILYMARRYDEARAVIDRAEANKVKVHPGLKKAVLDGLK
jgi:Tfp pilus assembly protein PilF